MSKYSVKILKFEINMNPRETIYIIKHVYVQKNKSYRNYYIEIIFVNVKVIKPFKSVSYTHLDVYKRQ